VSPLLPASAEHTVPSILSSSLGAGNGMQSATLSLNQVFQAHSLSQLGATDSSGEAEELERQVESMLRQHLEEAFQQAAPPPSMLSPGPETAPAQHDGNAVLADATSVRASTRVVASWLTRKAHHRS
jgi:hypothetical protein